MYISWRLGGVAENNFRTRQRLNADISPDFVKSQMLHDYNLLILNKSGVGIFTISRSYSFHTT